MRRTILSPLVGVMAAFLLLPALAEPVGSDGPRRRLDAQEQVAARQELARVIGKAIHDSGFDDARVGIHVRSVSDGTTLYARAADTLLNPASNMKVVTAAAALELLGPEFRFETELYGLQAIGSDGVLKGNLYVKGEGDPTFVSERMFRLVEDLWQLGLRRITGDIIIDDTYFDTVREGPGWEQESSDRAYIAPTGAVSLNYNAVAIHVRAGTKVGETAVVAVDPASDYFVIDNRVTTSAERTRRRHIPSSIGEGTRQRIMVRGRHPLDGAPGVYYRRIDNPPVYFGHTLKEYAKRRGIKFARGRVKLGTVPANAELLHRSLSQPLGRIVSTMNKVSQNHIAEQLLKTVGAEAIGPPGSWPRGVQAVEAFLEKEVGIPRGAYVMKNGSGLNDTNRFSPRQMTAILAHTANHFQVAPEFVASLAVAGRDGTTQYRLDDTDTAGRVRAKTGTLENVSALCGYARTLSGETVAFSILVNDHPGRYSTIIEGVDTIAAAVATYGGQPRPTTSNLALGNGPQEDDQAIQDRLQTYSSLGRARDPRNVRFLRSALRTEKDPLIRAVVAEAIFLSDPDVGRRILLDTFAPTTELLGRLRSLTYSQDRAGTPVLTSVADVAAEGDETALDRLLSAAYAGREDVGLVAELAVTLAEVARTAPEEILSALLRTEAPQGNTVVRILAEGIRAAGPGKHPLNKVVKERAAAEVDPEARVRLEAIRTEVDLARQLATEPKAPEARGAGPQALPAPSPGAAALGAAVRATSGG
ncbi:MAG: D-alanyl-D-alanine carboxypeptidase/D-alanyl-D-alanine-endopeptidase [Deltaproteobacteria bacterium]|nr:D-alanyl-D-alanine carboxypeptidase/D-alanyl-D-alanine-endopeptidase [Deltaproteobacteria bacterium]